MYISLDKKELGEVVGIAARFSERRSTTLPVLAGILVVAEEKKILLRATNLETAVELTLSGEVKKPGSVVLPASLLRDITTSFSGAGEVNLEHSGDTVTLVSGKAKSTLKTLPQEDFPSLPGVENPTTTFAIDGSTLKTLISTVAACASTSSVRPELASVYLSSEAGVVKAVATDSFRLAEKKLSAKGKVGKFSILIPAKNASDLAQTIPDEAVEVKIDDHQCAIVWPSGVVTTRLVAGSYPDYTQIIPKSFAAEASLLKKDFEAALKRASVFSDTFQKVRLGFDVKDKRLALSARNADVGESLESMPASVSGDSIELSFNHRYLGAALPLITSESITLSAAGIGRPLVIKGVGDASLLYLVMPMNQ